jgi:8-oxo-dGTP pyrophosphatase MutT (NUDIX family)
MEDSSGHVATVRAKCGVFLPGGGIEMGESAEQALVREAEEEAGLSVRIVREIGVADQRVFAEAEQTFFLKRSRFFVGVLLSASSRLESEHELVWLPREQAIAVLTHESHRWALGQDSA